MINDVMKRCDVLLGLPGGWSMMGANIGPAMPIASVLVFMLPHISLPWLAAHTLLMCPTSMKSSYQWLCMSQDCKKAVETISRGDSVGSANCQTDENVVVATGPAGDCQIVIRTKDADVANCQLQGSIVADVAQAILAAYPGDLTGGAAASSVVVIDVYKNPSAGEPAPTPLLEHIAQAITCPHSCTPSCWRGATANRPQWYEIAKQQCYRQPYGEFGAGDTDPTGVSPTPSASSRP